MNGTGVSTNLMPLSLDPGIISIGVHKSQENLLKAIKNTEGSDRILQQDQLCDPAAIVARDDGSGEKWQHHVAFVT